VGAGALQALTLLPSVIQLTLQHGPMLAFTFEAKIESFFRSQDEKLLKQIEKFIRQSYHSA